MELLFLGTSSGSPTKTRNVTGIAIRKAGSRAWCLVDCGEGTQHRLLQTKLSLDRLSAIFITHVHGDHCYGLPGLLDSASLAGRTEPLWIYGPAPIEQLISTVRAVSEARHPYPIHFQAIEEHAEEFGAGEFIVSRIVLSHRVPSFAYAFREKDIERRLDMEKLKQQAITPGPMLKQLQSGIDVTLDDGRHLKAEDFLLPARRARKIIISGDNDNPSLLRTACADADVLVHEATYTMEVAQKVGPAPQHCAAQTIAEFAAEAKLPNLVLTHFSARYQDDVTRSPSIKNIEDEAVRHYAGRLFLTKDLDLFKLNKEGELKKMSE